MNLYFRLIFIIINSFFKPKIDFDRELSLNLRVMPNDLDINNHLNNGRYLTLLDLASIALFLRSGIFKKMFRMGLKPIIGGTMISYRKGLSSFERFTIKIKLASWDERWCYFRFAFKNTRGVDCASGFFKGAFVSSKGLYSIRDAFESLGYNFAEMKKMPPVLRHWIAAEEKVTESYFAAPK